MSEAGEAAAFADIQRVLALFTQGLTGRHLHLKPFDEGAPLAAPRRIFTDGESIRLPAQIADFASMAHNLGAYRVAVLHQIGYLENGTFDFDLRIAGARMRLPAAPPAPPTSAILRRLRPTPRMAELERFFGLWPRPALLRRVFGTVEDLRVDSAMRRRYPGARHDLERVLAHALGRRPHAAAPRPLAFLLESLVQYSLGRPRAMLVAADPTGLADGMLEAAQRVETADANVYDSAAAALAICAALDGLMRRPLRAAANTSDAEDAADDAVPDLPATGAETAGGDSAEGMADAADDELDGAEVDFRGELAPDAVFRRLANGRAGTLEHDGIAELAAPEGTDNDSDGVPAGAARTPARAAALPPTPKSFLYDEWDYHAGDYKRAWCRVYEHRLRGDDLGFIDDVRRRHALVARQVRRRFDAIKPESFARVHGEREGEELELERAIQAVIDRRAGHVGDEHLYVRRQRGRREVAAAFLVDMSASTDFPIRDKAADAAASAEAGETDPYVWGRFGAPPDAPPPAAKRRVIDIAKESLALMGDALVALGDAHAIYGFSGSGRDNVEFHVAKDFGDPAGLRTWTALAAIEPRRSTRMGPAIRHALAKLRRQPERQRVLIIVSDGYPEDQDYGPDRRDIEYGIADTARALAEAERAGVKAFCITIDPAGHDYLRRMCAEDAYLVIDEVAALPAELSKVYRALTTGNRRRAGARAPPRQAAPPDTATSRG